MIARDHSRSTNLCQRKSPRIQNCLWIRYPYTWLQVGDLKTIEDEEEKKKLPLTIVSRKDRRVSSKSRTPVGHVSPRQRFIAHLTLLTTLRTLQFVLIRRTSKICRFRLFCCKTIITSPSSMNFTIACRWETTASTGNREPTDCRWRGLWVYGSRSLPLPLAHALTHNIRAYVVFTRHSLWKYFNTANFQKREQIFFMILMTQVFITINSNFFKTPNILHIFLV